MVPSLPKVSIVTPSYNQAQFLEEAILSVLNQDYPDIEYIIIDGGSTDGSVDIIRKYATQLAYWETEPDGGQADAINKGWRLCRGEFIGWLNSDDTLLPGTVHKVVDYLVSHPDVTMAYGDAYFTDENSQTIEYLSGQPFDAVKIMTMCNDYIVQPGSLMRRRALDLIGFPDTTIPYCFDFEYFMRLGLSTRIDHIPAPLATYRVHSAAKSQSRHGERAQGLIRTYQILFARRDIPDALQAVRDQALSAGYISAAQNLLLDFNGRMARRYLIQAIRLYPRAFSVRIVCLLLKSLLPREQSRWLRSLRVRISRAMGRRPSPFDLVPEETSLASQ